MTLAHKAKPVFLETLFRSAIIRRCDFTHDTGARNRTMKKTPKNQQRPTLRDVTFAQLVQIDPDLAEARREYASKTPERRRNAAQWEYDASFANDLLATAVARTSGERLPPPQFPAGVLALAIDPLYAPALVSVGSIEYQCGRIGAAMAMFLQLISLPPDEPELVSIVDQAGDFLVDQDDYANALRLFQAAVAAQPAVATYWSGVGYCLGRLGRKADAVAAERRAVALEPTSAQHLSDLGWSLVEAEAYAEARDVLERAVALAPADYDRPRANLEELERRIQHRARNQQT